MAKTYNTFTDVATGEVLTATNFNNVLENVANYRVPPMAIVRRTSDLTGYASEAAITWQSAELDTESPSDPMSAAGAPTVVTCRTAGIYLVQLQFHATASPTQTAGGGVIRKNGTVIGENFNEWFSPGAFPELRGNMALIVNLAVADTVAAGVRFTGGSAYVVKGAATTTFSQTRLAVTWLGQVS